jgi:hypothetical protein
MGVTTYATKLLFGGHLERRWLYFQFMGPIQNAIISPLAFLFDFERNDADLRRLDAALDPANGSIRDTAEHCTRASVRRSMRSMAAP